MKRISINEMKGYDHEDGTYFEINNGAYMVWFCGLWYCFGINNVPREPYDRSHAI